jgi:hypothetical protein
MIAAKARPAVPLLAWPQHSLGIAEQSVAADSRRPQAVSCAVCEARRGVVAGGEASGSAMERGCFIAEKPGQAEPGVGADSR